MMLEPSDYKQIRRNHGFVRRMRRLVRTSALPWWAKVEVCAALARSGPDAAWAVYERLKNEVENAI